MKILIDIDKLEQDGVLPPPLADVLRAHAIRDTGSTAINVLLALGAVTIAAGLLALVPHEGFAAFFGTGFILLGWLIKKNYQVQWGKLGSIWMFTGALTLSGSLGIITNQPFLAPLIAAAIFVFVGIVAESRLLIALVPLTLAAAIGGSTGYWDACYSFLTKEPTLTIVLFSALAYRAWRLAKSQKGLYQSLAIVFARMCVVLVNLGFWIGSLWGDYPGSIWHVPHTYYSPIIPEIVFSIGWAIALLLAGAWGAKHGRRFMVNTAAVFGALNFYTLWFDSLGMQPESVIVAGIATVAFALGLWRYNRKALAAE
jgi:iron complex transport system permease protein